MAALREQIKFTFYRAMEDSLEHIINSEKMTDEDIDWLVRLCTELKDRLNGLTPRRKDLHEELNKALDVTLLDQMLRHAAFDRGDLDRVISIVFDRLLLLCAPSQNATINELKEKIMNENFGRAVGIMILQCNKIIDKIEYMTQEFLRQISNRDA
tara:strand:- start:497 stop:961 length:465 start_codon:yes stop_codon:yes gene_type:complete